MPSSVFSSDSSDLIWSILLLYVAGFERSLRYAVCLFYGASSTYGARFETSLNVFVSPSPRNKLLCGLSF